MKPINLKAILLLSFWLGCAEIAHSETIVFKGAPRFKAVAMPAEAFNELLEGSKQDEAKLIITKENGRYIYTSREGKNLRYVKIGDIHYFFREDHSDFIKIAEIPSDEKAPLDSRTRYMYMEVISEGFKVLVSYWGVGEKLDL